MYITPTIPTVRSKGTSSAILGNIELKNWYVTCFWFTQFKTNVVEPAVDLM